MRRGALAALAGLTAALAAVALALAAPRAADEGRWSARPDAALPRSEVAAVAIGDVAYVAGGFDAAGRTLRAVEAIDLRTGAARRVAPMPIALNHPAAAAWRGRLYVVGGYTAQRALDGETGALLRYDPRTDRWRRLREMPTARGALTAGVIGDRLYAAGGAVDGRALATLEVLDLRTGRWRSGPPMRHAREHLGGAVLGGRLYVLAGRRAGTGNLTVAERFDPRRGRWEALPASRRPRGGTAAAAVAGRLVLVGGEDLQPGGATIAEVEAYDPRRRRWGWLAPLPTPRHGLGVVARGGGAYAIAGGTVPGLSASRTVEALTP